MNLMVDIETLSVDEERAVVLSVGAVPFWLWRDGPEMGDRRLWVLDLREQLAAGRLVDNKTVEWWSRQSAAAREHWLCADRVVSVPLFAREFCELVEEELNDRQIAAGGPENDQWDPGVWANGIMFDLGNLRSLITSIGCDAPWQYNQTRDARTIYRSFVQTGNHTGSGLAHDPVADCVSQIERLHLHWPAVMLKRPESRAKSAPGVAEITGSVTVK